MKIAVIAVVVCCLALGNGQDYGDYGGGANSPDYGQDSGNGIETGDYPCVENGVFADPTDPTKFHQCSNGMDIVMTCSEGTLWDDTIKSCNWQ